jgi:hypothetical protein
VSQYKVMISLSNIRMESDEKVKEHAKIALGAISNSEPSRSGCTLMLTQSCTGGIEHE